MVFICEQCVSCMRYTALLLLILTLTPMQHASVRVYACDYTFHSSRHRFTSSSAKLQCSVFFFGCFCFIFSHTDHFSFHFISGCRVCTRCARSHFSRTVPLSARHTLSVDQVHSFNFIHLHLLQFLVSFMLIRDVFYILLLRSNIAFFCALIWLAPRSFIIGILFGALCCFIVNIMLPFKPHFPFVSVC